MNCDWRMGFPHAEDTAVQLVNVMTACSEKRRDAPRAWQKRLWREIMLDGRRATRERFEMEKRAAAFNVGNHKAHTTPDGHVVSVDEGNSQQKSKPE